MKKKKQDIQVNKPWPAPKSYPIPKDSDEKNLPTVCAKCLKAKSEDGEYTGGCQCDRSDLLERGSDHYKHGKIQPIEFIMANGMGEGFCLGNVVKYVTRYKHSGKGLEDLKKARHYLDFWIEELDKGTINKTCASCAYRSKCPEGPPHKRNYVPCGEWLYLDERLKK